MSSGLLTAVLGVVLGMRHALEPDHLAAVSSLAAEQRSARAGLTLGAAWGLGHTLSLLAVGGTLALLETQLPPRLASGVELLVAVMVVGLGLRALGRAAREGRRGAPSTHAHGGVVHTHPAPDEHLHLRGWTLATRPLLVGVVHGLAGSGAVTALVLAELPSAAARLGYIGLFGLGSVAGMALLTGLFGVPLVRVARAPRAAAALLGVAGVVSVVVGAAWGVEAGRQLWGG
ncbi:MAG: hypothetical protein HY828_10325 [Actinobacteria bacterium]|nr:hypothetical protein [Actinomycetota bacterium]